MCKSKIHRATVTERELDYEGSITIDKVLLEKAGILPGERVDVLNLNNGSRTQTYAIEGKENSGCICLNGAAARRAEIGDKIIIIAYALMNEEEAKNFKPKLVFVNGDNRSL